MYKTIDLALQGGGSHGAFTWGVLERFLEAESLVIEGLCGTSAGAMNATMVAYGMHIGGREGAIKMLETFWKKTSEAFEKSPISPSFLDRWLGTGRMDFSPSYYMFDFMTTMSSPYQYNLFDINPLRDLLVELIDFEELRNSTAMKLFVCATNVRTSRPKVFTKKDISVDAVLASACLPYMFKAVEIDGEAYWDGGFMGNPPIFPLIDDTETEDIVLVQINPIHRPDIPKTAVEIRDRINELSFNSSLMHEMRRINFVQKMLEADLNKEGRLRSLHIHHVRAEEEMNELGVSSKLNADWDFLLKLRDLGRRSADTWLEKNYDNLGKMSTCDIDKEFL